MTKKLKNVKNYVFPTHDATVGKQTPANTVTNLGRYITPVQLQRVRHDVQMWRDAIREAEQAFYPHRVKMQRMYIDTILNGHTKACIERRSDMTLLREWEFVNDKNEPNPDIKRMLDKKWFRLAIKHAFDAIIYGYSLISLGDMVNGEFPGVTTIKRFNISPDRLNVTSYVYSLSGANFLEEPYSDFHLWVDTPTDNGISQCGYGLLYSVAVYEIIARNLLGNNADAAETYGQPTRVGKTQKTTEEERDTFAQALQLMGTSGWILLDALDEVELLEARGSSTGFEIYADLEERLHKAISKLVLGHADAMDSTPGKLGGGQDGQDSPVAQALSDKKLKDGAFVEEFVNDNLIPKLVDVFGFRIDPAYKFKFSNNKEKQAERKAEDSMNLVTAQVAQTMKNAGLEMDAEYFEKRTGIKTAKIEVQPAILPGQESDKSGTSEKLSDRVKNKLEKIYAY